MHVYLIEERIVGDSFEQFEKSESAAADLNEPFTSYEKGAKEFIEVMDNHYCMASLQSLTDELVRHIVEHWEKYSPTKLDIPKYKRFKEYLRILEENNGPLA